MSPITVVSLENLMMVLVLVGWLEYSHECTRSTVVGSAHSLVESQCLGEVGAEFYSLWAVCEEVFYPGADGGGEA